MANEIAHQNRILAVEQEIGQLRESLVTLSRYYAPNHAPYVAIATALRKAEGRLQKLEGQNGDK